MISSLNSLKTSRPFAVIQLILGDGGFLTLGQKDGLPLDGPAGLSPDVMLAPYDRIGGLGQQGHLAEYTLPDDGRYDDIDEQQVTMKDKIYGAPFVIESMVLYYNTDLLEKAPETFEELEALTEDEQYAYEGEAGKSVAFLANWVDFYNSYGLLNGFGGYVFGADGTDPSDIGLNKPEAIEGIQYATDWFQNTWPKRMLDVTTAGNFIDDHFTIGTAGAEINGPWAASNYMESGVNVGVATVPTIPNGEEYQPFAGGKGWVVSQYSENPELGQAFLDFATNEYNMEALYSNSSISIHALDGERLTIVRDKEK
nr:extracellular solute-binding protein [Vibrio coralliilyticus]